MSEKVRVCLITRFSIVIDSKVHSWRRLRNPIDPRSWIAARNPSREEKVAYLFDPARMEQRFHRFETLLLPSLAAQTEAAEHIVLASELMPDPDRARLEALSKRHGFRLHFAGTKRKVERILTEDGLIDLDGCDRLATARIDDDDAVARGFVRQVRRHARMDLDDYLVSFPKGIYLDQRTVPNRYAPVIHPNASCGLTRIVRKRKKTLSIHGAGDHRHAHHSFPVLQVPSREMFLSTAHGDNISRRLFLRRLPGGKPLTAEAAAHLQKRFGVDPRGLNVTTT